MVEIRKIPMSEIKAMNEAAGYHFFEKGAMRFFRSKIESREALVKGDDAYFITSEQFVPSVGAPHPRRYSVRKMDLKDKNIDTIGEFNVIPTKSDATKMMKEIVMSDGKRRRKRRKSRRD